MLPQVELARTLKYSISETGRALAEVLTHALDHNAENTYDTMQRDVGYTEVENTTSTKKKY